MKGSDTKATLLADEKHTALDLKQTDTGVTISLPDKAPDAIASVLCLDIKIAP